MNFPQRYIRMAEKSSEIQARIGKSEDCYVVKERVYVANPSGEDPPYTMMKPIWLPLPHQLLAMIENKNMSAHANLCYILNKTKKDLIYFKQFKTILEFLIVLVMWEKFEKVWVNGEWVER